MPKKNKLIAEINLLKDKIEELELRIIALEARPYYPFIPSPPPNPWPWPPSPIWCESETRDDSGRVRDEDTYFNESRMRKKRRVEVDERDGMD